MTRQPDLRAGPFCEVDINETDTFGMLYDNQTGDVIFSSEDTGMCSTLATNLNRCSDREAYEAWVRQL